MKRFLMALVLSALSMTLLVSCKAEKKQALDENKIYVYYLNTTEDGLYPVEFATAEKDADLLISELLKEFMQVPINVDAVRAPGDKVELMDCSLEDGILTVYFDSNYAEMKPARRTLCTAALTYTMSQVYSVDYVNIFSGETQLTDAEGKIIGPFSKTDFIDSISDVNAYDRAELTLYFSNETGDKLVAEKRSLMYSINNSLEKVALNELIKGPVSENLRWTINPYAKIANVITTDGVCYVTFTTDIFAEIAQPQKELMIYSIVNTLTELPNVSRVQISYGTESGETYDRNLNIIEGNE